MENITFYYKESEEYKAIKRLEEMTKNYSLHSKDLHYANVLYYLIINLQEKNEKLKENYERIYNENCILREEHNINDIGLLDENYKLKQVIDKAIEYIEWQKNNPQFDNIWRKYECESLVEILKG